jgi:hypothetical protein
MGVDPDEGEMKLLTRFAPRNPVVRIMLIFPAEDESPV